MRKILFAAIGIILLVGNVWGATYYVSPSGDDSDPTSGVWAAAYNTLQEALGAASSDGDIIVLEKSASHVLSADSNVLASITIRNEDDDEDYAACVVTVYNGCGIGQYDGDVVDDLTIKGVRFTGATYDGTNSRYGLITTTGAYQGTVTLNAVQFDNLHATHAIVGGPVLRLTSSYDTPLLVMNDCVVEYCTSLSGNAPILVEDFDFAIDGLDFNHNGSYTATTTQNGTAGYVLIRPNSHNINGTVKSSSFTDNINTTTAAGSGGDGILKIEATGDGYQPFATVSDCVFRRNAIAKIGALFVGKDAQVMSLRNIFSNNIAGNGGGGMGHSGGATGGNTSWVKDRFSSYIHNVSSWYGGAAYLGATSTEDVYSEISNGLFLGNRIWYASTGYTVYGSPISATANGNRIYNSVIRGAVSDTWNAGTYHIVGGSNDGFNEILNLNVEGGSGAISDTGATIANITSTDPVLGFKQKNVLLNEKFQNWTDDNPAGWEVFSESGTDPEVSQVGPTEGHGGAGTGACNIYTTGGIITLQKTNIFEIGKTYFVGIQTSNVVSGTIKLGESSLAGNIMKNIGTDGLYFATIYTAKQGSLQIIRYGACDVTIDNVFVMEISDDADSFTYTMPSEFLNAGTDAATAGLMGDQTDAAGNAYTFPGMFNLNIGPDQYHTTRPAILGGKILGGTFIGN